MLNVARKRLSTAKAAGLAAGGAIVLAPGLALAALNSTVLDTAVTGVTTDAQLAFDKAFPILTLVLGLMIGMALFKKFVTKAAS